MKQQLWKARLALAVVTAVAGSAALAAAAAAPTKEPAQAAGTSAAKSPATAAPAAPAKEATPATEAAKPAAPATPPAPTHTELFWPELWQGFHHPTSWLSMGLDQRIRQESGQNMQTLNRDVPADHDWSYQRYRTRWWTKWDLNEDVSFNTRLVWEFRTWEQPDVKKQWANPNYPGFADNPSVTHFNPDEALFDWFNVNLRNLGGLPLTATIGRQDMLFGVGWLVLDASPLDGSRTVGAFDAARFTYDWSDISTKIDAIYINNYPESDRWLKPINDQHRGLMEQEEQAAILYLTNTTWKPMQLEGYFIWKQDRPLGDTKQLTNFPSWWAQKGEVYTFGAAVSGMAAEHWKYRAEGAFQFGQQAGDLVDTPHTALGTREQATRDLQAFGTLDTVEYQFKDTHDNATHLTYEFDSGDDPGTTDRVERFDLLWGRWPRWSELMIFTYANETRIGDMVNLHRINIGHRINLNKQWQLLGDVHFLWADENSGAVNSSATGIHVSTDKKYRGTLLAPTLRYKMNDQLSAYGLFEYFMPGNYYVAPSNDSAWFFRFNLEYVF